jgi:hypothetical protein
MNIHGRLERLERAAREEAERLDAEMDVLVERLHARVGPEEAAKLMLKAQWETWEHFWGQAAADAWLRGELKRMAVGRGVGEAEAEETADELFRQAQEELGLPRPAGSL